MKLVNHPNIVKAEAFAEDEKYIYIVTEYMEGGDLYSFMVARGRGLS